MPRTIKIPAYARPVASVVTGRAALETAALDARVPETMVAIALARDGDALVLSRSIDRMRVAMEKWTAGLRVRRASGGGFSGYRLDGRTVWIGDMRSKLERAPFGHVRSVMLADAHAFPSNPVERAGFLRPDAEIFGGVIADRGHWWNEWARADGTMRVQAKASVVLREWPEQRAVADAIEQCRRARDLDLSEEQPPPPRFMRFARDRLRVITDKVSEFLSPLQRAEADARLGAGWEHAGGTPIVTFELSAAQRRYVAIKRWAWAQGFRRFLLLKYRRGGFTTLEQALSYHLAVTEARARITTLAHTLSATQTIHRIVDDFHKNDARAPENLTDSKVRLEFANGSFFHVGTALSGGFARGAAYRKVHGSEVSQWGRGANSVARVEALMAGITEAVGQHGEAVLETTPNGTEWFCNTYREAKKGVRRLIDIGTRAQKVGAWFPIFMRWFDDPANRAPPGTFDADEIMSTLSPAETSLIERHGLDAAQLAFRRTRVARLKHLFPQEYPEDDVSCFIATGHPFFDAASLIRWADALDRIPVPVPKHVPGGEIVVVEPPVEGAEYVMGVDTSEGVPGGDYGFVGVLRRDPVRQVAWIHGHFRPQALARLTFEMGRRYNRALTSVEREAYGFGVIEELTKMGYGKSHLVGGPLFWCAPDRAGWTTTDTTRAQLLDTLSRMIDSGMEVRHRRMIDEAITFRLQKSGRYDHDPGCHDDTLFGWGQACRMLGVPRMRPGFIGSV